MDGAGVRLVRVLGHRDVQDFDPFLLLDAFDSTDPDDYVRGFPWHPHRGIRDGHLPGGRGHRARGQPGQTRGASWTAAASG
ncbi:MAG: pirin family protein [Desulfomicrobium escambiense]|nr:pirin family protein [Desulfomicrobium escambiense]